MEKAIQKCIKSIRGKSFDKMVAVANPALGLEFEKEVDFVLSLLFDPILIQSSNLTTPFSSTD